MRQNDTPLTMNKGSNPALWQRLSRFGAIALTCVVVGAPVTTADDLCGATVLASLTLDHDLACVGDGLVVGADGIEIDLNGHTLSGTGIGVGIAIADRNEVEITNGVISGFAVGLRLNASTEVVIKHLELVGNPEGIDLQAGSVDNTIMGNVFRNSTTRAIMLRGDTRRNDVRKNQFLGNRVGILVFGAVDSTVRNNLVAGSSLAGIRFGVTATANAIESNTVTGNAAGIEFLVVSGSGAVGNHIEANKIATNGCGLKGPTAGNTFTANALVANLADTCP